MRDSDRNAVQGFICGVLLFVVIALAMGCSSSATYDEMTEAVKTAPAAEREGLKQRIRRFEQDVERAEAFFERRATCSTNNKTVWYCDNPLLDDRQIDRALKSGSLDEIVRAYRRLRTSCGCVETRSLTQ